MSDDSEDVVTSSRSLNRRVLATLGLFVVLVGVPLLVTWWLAQPSAADEVSPADFGAVGDGVTDDTVALQRAFDSVAAGGTVTLPRGSVFAHSRVLTLSTPDIRVTGGGTLLATNEQFSAVWVRADRITVESVTLAITTTSRRWDAYEQMKLRIGRTVGVTVTDVTITGSAAAGVYVGGAAEFRLARLQVSDTRADGIQMTEGSSDGTVSDVTVTGSGDDGVSVVSYRDAPACERITISRPRVVRQLWGRGLAVVGGRDITLVDIYAEYSSSAGLYISSEANFNTLPVSRVRVFGGTLLGSNQTASVGHGAVLLYNGQQWTDDSDIAISQLAIIDTRSTAPWNVGLLNEPGATHSRIVFDRISVTGGPRTPFATNASEDSFRISNWLVDGTAWPMAVCP